MSKMSQTDYIAILFIDIGFDRSADRRAWLQREFGVPYADQLSTLEASECIERLKAIKQGLREREQEGKGCETEY